MAISIYLVPLLADPTTTNWWDDGQNCRAIEFCRHVICAFLLRLLAFNAVSNSAPKF